jgi:pyruvate dehydrogenase E2 component (dihydrolipoamide acetyltransferase)
MRGEFHHVVLPDLGLGPQPVVLSLWLVKRGARVTEGEPLVEVLAGVASVDLPAPCDGVLAKKFAAEGSPLTVGQRLAAIESEPSGA